MHHDADHDGTRSADATIETVDLYGQPFVDITFITPFESEDLIGLAASLSAVEREALDAEDVTRTVLTGASTIRDVLIAYSPDLRLLYSISDTLEALGGAAFLDEIVAVTAHTFVLRDVHGTLWDVHTGEAYSAEVAADIQAHYDDILANNDYVGFVEMMEAYWEQLEGESEAMQAEFGYRLADLVDGRGGLDVGRLAALQAQVDLGLPGVPTEVTYNVRQCVLFVCWTTIRGHIPAAHQATQGGEWQSRAYYGLPTPPTGFNLLACVTNSPVNGLAALGCGPSAFIGLVGEKYKNHGATFSGMSLSGNVSLAQFRRWMVEEVGSLNRPRIADYMGTCVLGTNYDGFTSIGGFVFGAEAFLSATGSGLTLKYTAGIGGSTGYNVSTAAWMIDVQIGKNNNPVVATYWPSTAAAHYAAISHYDITWGAGITINVRTMDGEAAWYGLSSHWTGQIGVYHL